MNVKSLFGLLKKAVQEWIKDGAPRLGAALSYYTIFALPPLFIIVVFVASLFLDEQAVRSGLLEQVGGLVGQKGAEAIESTMAASNPQGTGTIASIIAIVTLILTATGLFIELQHDFNLIWHVEEKPGQGIRGFIHNRLLSFTMVVVIGFLLLVSLVVSASLAALGKYFSGIMPGSTVVWNVVNLVVSLGVITALFAIMFKVLPDIKIAWRDVWVGAALTALLFTIGKALLGLYLGQNKAVTAYGAAGSLVLILLWVYYSAQILFFGAEFTKVLAKQFGVQPVPKPNARWTTAEVKSDLPQRGSGKLTPVRRPLDTKELLLAQLRDEVEALRTVRNRLENRTAH
jgi:membrane protein